MDWPTYNEIKNKLHGLRKQEQYNLLLTTLEWNKFRRKFLDLNGNICAHCQAIEGPIEKEIPYDQWKEDYDWVMEYNKSWQKYAKEHPNEIIQQLLEGRYSGRIAPPSRYITVGQIVVQIHHRFYFDDKLPWEYSSKWLLPLCQDCHKAVHRDQTIYIYRDESMKYRYAMKNCWKCEGTGYLQEFSYRDNGICYECSGLGFNPEDSHEWDEVAN